MNYLEDKTLAQQLLRPQTLSLLFLIWLIVVLVGSSAYIVYIQLTRGYIPTSSVTPVSRSQEEVLAQNTNVALDKLNATGYVQSGVFPTRLVIPSIGTDLPVSNPQTRNIKALDEKLLSSVVRYPGSATVGENNRNMLIFGHSSYLPFLRNNFYRSFNKIETLKKGDSIDIISNGDTYVYKVTKIYKTSALDGKIPLSVTSGSRLTLLTCDSFGKKSDRWVVEANFVGKTTK